MKEDLQGLWTFTDPRGSGDFFLKIFSDGRLAQFYKQYSGAQKYVCMTMRAEREIENSFRIKTKPEAEGYLIDMHRDASDLSVTNKGVAFICRPVPEEGVPSWLDSVLANATWR